MRLARTDKSFLGNWWWTIDRWTLGALALLLSFGAIMSLAATPAIANKINLESLHFVRRHFFFLAVGVFLIVGTSLLNLRGVRRFSVFIMFIGLVLMVLVIFVGPETKGATRWLSLWGVSIQPSEFIKPSFAVLAAWAFSEGVVCGKFPGNLVSTVLFLLIFVLLLLQPDIGMAFVIASIWITEFFVAGMPLILVCCVGVIFIFGGVLAYLSFDHVQIRVDRFLDLAESGGYQVARALEAFKKGGLIGRGPGEGRVKELIPDAHSDFVFAVVGEEFGLIVCLAVLALFIFILFRGVLRVFQEDNLFVLLAVCGLLTQFTVQALINLASTVNLIPPKGMTLPFISYGGSSILALAIGMGLLLALTRRRVSEERQI